MTAKKAIREVFEKAWSDGTTYGRQFACSMKTRFRKYLTKEQLNR